jgi:2-oxoglutarate ferredoxin oxidoreductase subunit beta
MPSVATGANAANRDLYYIGVSGDGDTLSIGMGQFSHALRRNLNMLYLIENNGVYGLTKGQFSASADIGSTAKKGEANNQTPIDPCVLAMSLGGTFIARSFSGDRDQLVPLLKAGLKHNGFGMIDIVSPCVTFNDHEGSTKSYKHTREHYHPAIHTDYVEPSAEIRAQYDEGEVMPIALHDGSQIIVRKLDKDYDPRDRGAAFQYLQDARETGEIVTGLLYVDENLDDMHAANQVTDTPLIDLPFEAVCPGSDTLQSIQNRYR